MSQKHACRTLIDTGRSRLSTTPRDNFLRFPQWLGNERLFLERSCNCTVLALSNEITQQPLHITSSLDLHINLRSLHKNTKYLVKIPHKWQLIFLYTPTVTFTISTTSIETNFSHLSQLWKLYHWIKNRITARRESGPLINSRYLFSDTTVMLIVRSENMESCDHITKLFTFVILSSYPLKCQKLCEENLAVTFDL